MSCIIWVAAILFESMESLLTSYIGNLFAFCVSCRRGLVHVSPVYCISRLNLIFIESFRDYLFRPRFTRATMTFFPLSDVKFRRKRIARFERYKSKIFRAIGSTRIILSNSHWHRITEIIYSKICARCVIRIPRKYKGYSNLRVKHML